MPARREPGCLHGGRWATGRGAHTRDGALRLTAHRGSWLARTTAVATLILLLAPGSSRAAPPSPDGLSTEGPSLDEKAAHFRSALVEQHLSPEGLLLYRLHTGTEREVAEGKYPDLADTPTFNGMLAATACLEADVAPPDARDEALELAERAISGLELLMAVTGRRGLLARGIRRASVPSGGWPDAPAGRWTSGAPGYESYSWRGDVSMDQYASGLLPAIWECRLHFPERTRKLAVDYATLLVEDDMRLYDPDGRRTTYGDLSWRSGRGANSIAQLTGYAGLAVAAELDPETPTWAAARDHARAALRVPAGARVTNVRIAGLTNFSNDLMAWNLYRVLIPLARQSRDPALADLRHGMHRAWLRVRRDENAYFTLILCRIEPESCDVRAVAAAREVLERFPIDKMHVEPASELPSLSRRWLPSADLVSQAQRPVPIELRRPSSFEWKSDPYRIEYLDMSGLEYTGLDYLAAYWLLVSHDAAHPAPPAVAGPPAR